MTSSPSLTLALLIGGAASWLLFGIVGAVHEQLAFEVAPASSRAVTLSEVVCLFSWSATRNGTVESLEADDSGAATNNAAPVADAPALTIDGVVALLKSEVAKLDNCVRTNHANFVYELCLNRDCTQALQGSADRWLLGRFDHANWLTKDDVVALELGGGDLCKPTLPTLPRSLVLYLQCGSSLAFGNFRETATCVYAATLAAPFACEPSIQPFLAGQEKIAAMQATIARWDEASWLLEGGDTADGRRFCTAYNTGAGSRTLHVSKFSLSLANDADVDSADCTAWVQFPNKSRIVMSKSDGEIRLDAAVDSARISCLRERPRKL
jgi:hypothetical protein